MITIKKAVELLTEMSEPGEVVWSKQDLDAIKLGKEALKRIQTTRFVRKTETVVLLPGETK